MAKKSSTPKTNADILQEEGKQPGKVSRKTNQMLARLYKKGPFAKTEVTKKSGFRG